MSCDFHSHDLMKFPSIKKATAYADLMRLTASEWTLKRIETPLPNNRMEFYYSWVRK